MTCGPPVVFMRPALLSKFIELLFKLHEMKGHFLRPILARGDIFASLCGPWAFFFIKMWPANIYLSLRSLLYAMSKKDKCKSIGAKAACKMLMKLTLVYQFHVVPISFSGIVSSFDGQIMQRRFLTIEWRLFGQRRKRYLQKIIILVNFKSCV